MILALIVAVILLYMWHSNVYAKNVLDKIVYDVTLSHKEVFVGDIIWLYENITNTSNLAVPYAKVDTELPDGLSFLLDSSGDMKPCKENYIESVFALEADSAVRRRWRVICLTRGEYNLGSVLLVTNNLFGLNANSARYTCPASSANTITVLPQTVDLNSTFTSSIMLPGEMALPRGIYTDPMIRAGVRDYSTLDPMNKINWKLSAAKNKLLVHVEEYTNSTAFNIVLNMQSRDIEKDPKTPSVPYYIEYNITTAASIFEAISTLDLPCSVIANGFSGDYDKKPDEKFMYTEPYKGHAETIEVLRLLAKLKLEISLPFEKLLDIISSDPYKYAPSGNLVIISSFFNERMVNFHSIMKKAGVDVSFYITTTERIAINVPSDIQIFTIYQGRESNFKVS